MNFGNLVLITGAGGVGSAVVEKLRAEDVPVRVMVRQDDGRAARLRALGAEIVLGDLTRPETVAAAMDGARSMYFAMPVSPDHLLAATVAASVAREYGKLDALVGMSQMTVSQMTATSTAESHQQRLHWLAEQVLNWSGLPVVHIRPTSFLDNPLFTTLPARTIQENGTIVLPFGSGRTSPIAVDDVARAVATVLRDPGPHDGRVYELTGPRTVDMTEMADAFAKALGRAGVVRGRAARDVAQRGALDDRPAAAHRAAHHHHVPPAPAEPLRPGFRRCRAPDRAPRPDDRRVRGGTQGLLPGLMDTAGGSPPNGRGAGQCGAGRRARSRRPWCSRLRHKPLPRRQPRHSRGRHALGRTGPAEPAENWYQAFLPRQVP